MIAALFLTPCPLRAQRRAPHDNSVQFYPSDTAFSSHTMPRDLSPAVDVRLFLSLLTHIDLLVGYRPYSAYKNPASGFVKKLGNCSPFRLLQDIPELPLLGQCDLAPQTLPFFSRSPSRSCLAPPTSQKGPLNNRLVLRLPLGLRVA